ncbi:MAG TPA: hypothetical protein VD927_17555 [Chryseosolibacter sp.]|nr:hypothetical protein [Chryseosolibacter sp.]
MDYGVLHIFLPAFMLVFLGTISVWSHVRKNKKINVGEWTASAMKTELKLVDLFFKVLLVLSIGLSVLYAYFPEYYYIAGPIEWLDVPVINTVGVLVLKTSLVWIVMAQFNIEKTIAMFNSGVSKGSLPKLFTYSRKLILTGMLIMFFGLFITISSVLAIMICIIATWLFDRVKRLSV